MLAAMFGSSSHLSPFDAYRRNARFGSLDGLRAISVAAVVWDHTGEDLVNSPLAQGGHHGVTLFFAISGFLITTLLLREWDRHGCIDLKAFYIRRALRIFPLYYAVLLLYVLLVWLLERDTAEGREFFDNLLSFATYTSNWFVALDGRVIFYFSWSLAAEEQFYLVWPPLLRRIGSRARALALVMLVVVALVLAERLLQGSTGSGIAALAWRVIQDVPLAIVAGVAIALLQHDPKWFARLHAVLAATRWHALLWASVAIGLTIWPSSPWAAEHLAWPLVVAACTQREDHVLARGLALRFVAYMGTISYGMYLMHMLCKNALVRVFAWLGVEAGPLLLFAATLLLTVAVAGASFRWFEARFLRMKRPFERDTTAVDSAARP